VYPKFSRPLHESLAGDGIQPIQIGPKASEKVTHIE